MVWISPGTEPDWKQRTRLPLRLDLRRHSPDGFEWGYAGSGPAQLALAILAHHLGDDAEALRLYQDFKTLAIAHLRATGVLSSAAVACQLAFIRGDRDGIERAADDAREAVWEGGEA